MMRAYCEEAKIYGEKPLPQTMKPKHVTVILNPEANYKKANIQFEKFAAPLLHLAGIKVSIFQTEKEKQAQELMRIMSNTDAVIIAGGDGTVQEAITGLLRRPTFEEENLPVGIIPLGKTNAVAQYLFGSKSSSRAQLMAEAAMAVIRETTTNMDVLKVQFSDEKHPVYGMIDFEQGLFGDIEPLVEKYWYLGFLKDKYTYMRNSSKDWKPIVNDSLEYVAPCSGCSKCYIPPKKKDPPPKSSRWWQVFVPRQTDNKASSDIDKMDELKASRINEDCGKHILLPSGYSNITISTPAADSKASKIYQKGQIISSGLSHRKSKLQDDSGVATVVEARQLIINAAGSMNDSNDDTPASVDSSDLVSSEQTQSVPSTPNDSIEIISSDQSGSTSLPNNSVVAASLESKDPDSPVSSASTNGELSTLSDSETSSIPEATTPLEVAEKIDSEEPSAVSKIEKPVEDVQNEAFSYIDKEKYKRTSCIISILPKKVTVYA
ncbi:Acylglycerol kinase like protein [Argiope bruennichi]|uniref:Acylglycerol kinase like protein n=1 Tax=Argiope bruennichi TaxID=94029 RepID=A0A8T0FAG8_ARGBR|nr:Acylglycerol kinase like protein [Argiope bruennichi]